MNNNSLIILPILTTSASASVVVVTPPLILRNYLRIIPSTTDFGKEHSMVPTTEVEAFVDATTAAAVAAEEEVVVVIIPRQKFHVLPPRMAETGAHLAHCASEL